MRGYIYPKFVLTCRNVSQNFNNHRSQFFKSISQNFKGQGFKIMRKMENI